MKKIKGSFSILVVIHLSIISTFVYHMVPIIRYNDRKSHEMFFLFFNEPKLNFD